MLPPRVGWRFVVLYALATLRGEPYDRSGHVVESALMFRQSHGPSPDRGIIARARKQRRVTA